MKPRILIFSHALELGGAERSLIGLLDALDPNKCDVDLFLMRHEGELLQDIPSHIHLLPELPAYTVLARPLKNVVAEGHVFLATARLLAKVTARYFDRKHHYTDSEVGLNLSHKFLLPLVPRLQPAIDYDLAISFLTPHYFVANKVRAKKKLAWIHTDYTHVQIDIPTELAMWSQYDHIASISPSVTKGFLSIFSSLSEKIIEIENILPENFIRRKSEDFMVENEMAAPGIKLLSIGRYCTAKNFDNIPWICSQIRQNGLDVTWYIIGFGGDEQLIKDKIHENHMENHVILLGKKANPYPYIKACDVYIQPSRYEGKSVTVREAQILHKPVIITRFATADSQLEDGQDGIIVSIDNDHCAQEIAALLLQPKTLNRLQETCASRDYSNKSSVERLYELI